MTAPPAQTPRAPSAAALAAVDGLRRSLSAILWGRALLVGAAAGAFVLVAERVALLAGAPPRAAGAGSPFWLALAAGTLAAAALRWRDGRVDRARAALWVEERRPEGFVLVTAVEPQTPGVVAMLERRLASGQPGPLAGAAAARALGYPFVALLILVAALSLLPSTTAIMAGRAADGGAAVGAGRHSAGAAPGLGVVTVGVRAPAYSGLPGRTERDPESVTALVGSTVNVAGRTAGEVGASDGTRPIPVTREGDGWSLELTMPDSALVARLSGGGGERLLLLMPVPDSAPVVTLAASVRDTVLRTAAGTVALAAEASDDLGLVSGGFEYIVSSGEGESFTFRGGTLGERELGGERRATLNAELRLDGLGLKPGDLVHVRALARDGNVVSGPGVGSSETRTIRIARPGEGDSLAVDGAPPPALDTAALSQRMLLEQTERLERDRPRLTRDTVLARAGRISTDQTRLRKRVGELVYTRLGEEAEGEHSHFPGDGHDHGVEGKLDPDGTLARASAATGGAQPEALDFHGDESPVVAVNRPLLEAYNHMWDATRALDMGEPANAIPPMRRALEALQRARQAERIYLRGRPPTVVVDVAGARLQGRTHGEANTRTPRTAIDPAIAARTERLERALRMLATDEGRAAASDSLILLQADALRSEPLLAAAIATVLERLRTGQDVTEALQGVRRAAAGAPQGRGGLPAWGGAP